MLILGSLDGQLAGVRQLRRPLPLETQVVEYAGQVLRIPTYHELLRIKAYLILERNYTRDYVDFLALASNLKPEDLKESLSMLDRLYGGMRTGGNVSGNGMLFDLGMALQKAEPRGTHKREWVFFDAMEPGGRPWDLEHIRQEGRVQGERVLTLWRTPADNDAPRDADALRERKTPKDRPTRHSGMF